jgi:hypothetical protein
MPQSVHPVSLNKKAAELMIEWSTSARNSALIAAVKCSMAEQAR